MTALEAGPHRTDLRRNDDVIDAATLAVVAHGLLNSLTVISAAAAALERGDHFLERERRESLFELIQTETRFIAGTLGDLVLGLPPDVVAELDALINPHPHSL
jgi:K+-sensing histidine kinase KdpD